MFDRRRLCKVLRATLLYVAAAGVAACARLPFSEIDDGEDELKPPHQQEEVVLDSRESQLTSARRIWDLAATKQPPQRQKERLRAAAFLQDRAFNLQALSYLVAIDEKGMAAPDLFEKRLLEADIRVRLGQRSKLTELLPPELFRDAPPETRLKSLQLLLAAYKEDNDEVSALRVRALLDPLLAGDDLAENQLAILSALGLIATKQSAASSDLANDPALLAWLALYSLTRESFSYDKTRFSAEISTWEDLHPNLELTDQAYQYLLTNWEFFNYEAKNVALLLPLSGAFAKIGRVVESGFFYARAKQSTYGFSVKVYDSEAKEDISETYNEAVREADFVVGPLLKKNVLELAVAGAKVPTLVLNYLPAGTSPKGEIYQFGLLPEEEVEQAAAKILGDGHRYVIVVQQNDDYGERLYDAFTKSFVPGGGVIRERALLENDASEHSSFVKQLYQLYQSEERYRQLATTIGKEPRFTPQMRNDIDATVLLLAGTQLELLYPFIKYHYADKAAVYGAVAKAHTPSGGTPKPDLNGLIYPEIPWLLAANEKVAAGLFAPEFARLFAFGGDAYFLVSRARKMVLDGSTRDGFTGKIHMLKDGKLARNLSWAKFRNGYPRKLAR